MGKKMLTYVTTDNRGYCEVHVDYKHEMFYIKYFDSTGKQFYTEDFPNKSFRYVQDAAENWVNGIKKLEDV